MNGAVGRRGEQIAADYLARRGLRIMFRNYRCRGGELDLVALHGEELVFVEVRSRTAADWGDAVESVNGTKKRRWVHAARCFCAQHPEFSDLAMRFDLVAMQGHDSVVSWIQDSLQLNE